jgi:antitoxin CcdA
MKQRANVTVDGKLLAEAKSLGINLSETLETSLRAKVKEEGGRRWLEENRAAIESFNRYVNEHGTFGERVLAAEAGVTVAELGVKRSDVTASKTVESQKRSRKGSRGV